MSDSLKDQLRALGLKPNKAPTKVSSEKPAGADISLDQAYRMRTRQERQQKEKAAALKRKQERQRREINQKIKALIKANAIRDEAAEIKRNFLYKGRIRNILVTPEQLRALNEGQLGVVYLAGNYSLMPSAIVAEVSAFSAGHVPDLKGADSEGEEEHPVPDDLTW